MRENQFVFTKFLIHCRGRRPRRPANRRRELEFICDVRTNKLPSGREVSPKVTIGARASKALIISSALFIEASLPRAPFVFCYAKSTSLPEGGKYTRDLAVTRRDLSDCGIIRRGGNMPPANERRE